MKQQHTLELVVAQACPVKPVPTLLIATAWEGQLQTECTNVKSTKIKEMRILTIL